MTRATKRAELRAEGLPPDDVVTIARNFPYFSRLSAADQRELTGHVHVFLDEKRFEGCGGLELTREIKVTIAAQACVLLLHRDADYYPKLDVILVYPHTYRVNTAQRVSGHVVVTREQARLGESHQHGVVVLSWDSVRSGAADPDDGQNVVFHEFAHQLDQEDGAADGAPILEKRSSYAPWARILGEEYEALAIDAAHHRETVIDKYGAESPAEFFAVVTEAFFEKPQKLSAKHPELYGQLLDYYKQDPLERLGTRFEPPPPRKRALPQPREDKHTIRFVRTSSCTRLPNRRPRRVRSRSSSPRF